jgi:hypothetical protein
MKDDLFIWQFNSFSVKTTNKKAKIFISETFSHLLWNTKVSERVFSDWNGLPKKEKLRSMPKTKQSNKNKESKTTEWKIICFRSLPKLFRRRRIKVKNSAGNRIFRQKMNNLPIVIMNIMLIKFIQNRTINCLSFENAANISQTNVHYESSLKQVFFNTKTLIRKT